ncbi:MAG: hypothetical protein IH848_00450 [Acidobacteria bacterium]|nr:hypothetical protein [Acidobacteriota bacterium]
MSLFLIGLGVLAAAPMFMYAIQGNAVGAEKGAAGALAVEQMEILRDQASFDQQGFEANMNATLEMLGNYDILGKLQKESPTSVLEPHRNGD